MLGMPGLVPEQFPLIYTQNQHLADRGMDMADKWGPMAIISIGFVVILALAVWGFIKYANNVNKNAVLPTQDQQVQIIEINKKIDNLFQKYDALKEDMRSVEIELERRLTKIWAEEKLLPKIEILNTCFVQFKAEVSTRLFAIEKQLTKGE